MEVAEKEDEKREKKEKGQITYKKVIVLFIRWKKEEMCGFLQLFT